MKEWFRDNKVGILALLITLVTWILVASILPDAVINVITSFAFGWFFLGDVVQPWVERKLEKLFD